MTGSNTNEASFTSAERGRSLGGQERLLYLYSKRHHRHFCLVGKLSGNISRHDLAIALRKVQARHAKLSYSVHEREEGPHFVYSPKDITVRAHSLNVGSTWHEIVEAELATPFDASQAPLVRITALREPLNQRELTLVLTFHHALADGLSAVAFLDDLVAAMNSAELPPVLMRPSVERLLELEAPRDPSPQEINVEAAPLVLEEVGREPLWRSFEGDTPKVGSVECTANFTAGVVARCKRELATVQGALAAALSAVNSARHECDDYAVLSPISVRHFAGIDASDIGVFLTVGLVRLPMKSCVPFWERARSFGRELQALRSKEAVALSAHKLEKALPPLSTVDHACGLIGSMRYDAVISNLGVLQTRASSEPVQLQAIWGPMVLGRIKNERMIGASTYGTTLRLTESRPAHVAGCLPQLIGILSEECDV
ncbi:condensation domain-containing protein [Neorhizobium sp. AL 9.2.2]|uniref:condensation domain-containing protein n=1 Tax=Neorhizobium sp. AL 9.2.2 TaxID=2712894 RepID=UPI001572EC8A|nr:condensation domain-containing protein [Neorhizobium sp. AL 9.2.2]NSY20164.1 hypothetical protein [Neorhizobium sp. AL 9.2.2]